MVSEKPLVSILTTSYNYGRYIGQTIQSVLDQTYDNWEMIISDDASSDNSLEIIRAFDDPRITLITSEKNEGGTVNRAKAYALCRGKYLNTLNSDDAIVPDKLEKQVKYLEEHPEVDILATFVTEIDSNDQPVGNNARHEVWFNQTIDLNQPEIWIWQNHVCHSSVMLRKAMHDRVGAFNPHLVYTGDYEFWVRCLTRGAIFQILPEKFTLYRSHGSNITNRDPQRVLEEMTYIQLLLKAYLVQCQQGELLRNIIYVVYEQGIQRGADKNLRATLIQQLLLTEPEENIKDFLSRLRQPASLEALAVLNVFDFFAGRSYSLTQQNSQLTNQNSQLTNQNSQLTQHVQNLQQLIKVKEQDLQNLINQANNLEKKLDAIERTKAWQLIQKWYSVKNSFKKAGRHKLSH